MKTIPPFALSNVCRFRSMRAWWPLGDDEDNDGDDGGKENGEPATTATPELPQQRLCTTNSSPLPREPTLRIDPKTRRSQAVEYIGRDLRDVEPSSLLAQQHIRTLLVIDGLYSVCLCAVLHSLSGLGSACQG